MVRTRHEPQDSGDIRTEDGAGQASYRGSTYGYMHDPNDRREWIIDGDVVKAQT